MMVDVFYPGWVPFAGLGLCRDIPGFVDHHDYALAYDFDTLISGHLTRLGTRADVETQREYVTDLRREALRALAEVDQVPSWQYVSNGPVGAERGEHLPRHRRRGAGPHPRPGPRPQRRAGQRRGARRVGRQRQWPV